MSSAFKECYRVLKEQGVLTVMFTHKKVEAWDSLAKSLLNAGFEITASWPIHTESEYSLHQAKQNAASSTILLICRKRSKTTSPTWWEEIKPKIDKYVKERAQYFEENGIRGQDIFIASFGPALQILSENWPVKTKSGEIISPQEALDRARNIVGNWFIDKITYGKSTSMDKITRFYIMAWFIYKAREVKFDEINRLAISLGIDLDKLKQLKIIERKGEYIRFLKPNERFTSRALKSDSEEYNLDIDYVHTAIYSYEIGKSLEVNRFHQRTGAIKKAGYLDTIVYLLDVYPRTDEVTEYYTLLDISKSSLRSEIKQRLDYEMTDSQLYLKQSLLEDLN
jgi:adenine-specific DNA methylase